MESKMEATIYFVGLDQEDALSCLPFDSFESAESYMNDAFGGEAQIYRISVEYDINDAELVSDTINR